jgi:hypothetical protein
VPNGSVFSPIDPKSIHQTARLLVLLLVLHTVVMEFVFRRLLSIRLV